jgi:hypothetical protein
VSTDGVKLEDCPQEGEMSEACQKAKEEAEKAKAAEEGDQKKTGGSG